jgi:hypothetical protein
MEHLTLPAAFAEKLNGDNLNQNLSELSLRGNHRGGRGGRGNRSTPRQNSSRQKSYVQKFSPTAESSNQISSDSVDNSSSDVLTSPLAADSSISNSTSSSHPPKNERSRGRNRGGFSSRGNRGGLTYVRKSPAAATSEAPAQE